MDDLITVADFCTRFSQNAVQSAHLKMESVTIFENSSAYDFSMLRNFGAVSKSIHVHGHCIRRKKWEYQKRIIKYCTSIELRITDFNLTDEIGHLMQPLLARVQKLAFASCKFSKSFLQNLLIWLPELCELSFSDNTYYNVGDTSQFVSRFQKYPKLEVIAFWYED